jgi:hypothetical protein
MWFNEIELPDDLLRARDSPTKALKRPRLGLKRPVNQLLDRGCLTVEPIKHLRMITSLFGLFRNLVLNITSGSSISAG